MCLSTSRHVTQCQGRNGDMSIDHTISHLLIVAALKGSAASSAVLAAVAAKETAAARS